MNTQLPLTGVRIFDLTRILAGPTCTQLLGDLGADVIKVEKPGVGDDTRTWGPPYVKDPDGKDTNESAYYLSANRNKRSVTIDLQTPKGIALAKKLIAKSDILIENFKVGSLSKLGLGYEDLKTEFPRLVYCSVTGFGQTGPYASRAGYDFLAQGLGGIMSITGDPDGEPMKVGVGIADVMTGMYASTAILAALRHRDATGEGQHIDTCLLDTQVSWLINEGTNYLVSGKIPVKLGNEHPNIVPYKVFATSNGHVILAVGNNRQFDDWCTVANADDLKSDPRYASNPLRIANRETLYDIMPVFMKRKTTEEWLVELGELKVPCSPVNNIEQVFEDPHVKYRGMRIEMDHPTAGSGKVPLIGNPVKMSSTPPQYRLAPPTLGQHSDEVLRELLGFDEKQIQKLKNEKTI
jgi:crotonobetainyl-CoA:carnitine CoA-transferase CaiB-like acyl-CoA transferase|tara:strand:+ start:12332 stop:13555 length:1224 start_codon:yes stop_codon:yes gene_type:complete